MIWANQAPSYPTGVYEARVEQAVIVASEPVTMPTPPPPPPPPVSGDWCQDDAAAADVADGYGTCPSCGKRGRVKVDGRLRNHKLPG